MYDILMFIIRYFLLMLRIIITLIIKLHSLMTNYLRNVMLFYNFSYVFPDHENT